MRTTNCPHFDACIRCGHGDDADPLSRTPPVDDAIDILPILGGEGYHRRIAGCTFPIPLQAYRAQRLCCFAWTPMQQAGFLVVGLRSTCLILDQIICLHRLRYGLGTPGCSRKIGDLLSGSLPVLVPFDFHNQCRT